MNSFDTVCHEHLEYYSLAVIERVLASGGLEVVRVELNDVNGGSIRLFAGHAGAHELRPSRPASTSSSLRARELELRLGEAAPYLGLRGARGDASSATCSRCSATSRSQGKTIHIYGASTKGNTTLQYCGIDSTLIDCAADRNPDKWGSETIGSRHPDHLRGGVARTRSGLLPGAAVALPRRVRRARGGVLRPRREVHHPAARRPPDRRLARRAAEPRPRMASRAGWRSDCGGTATASASAGLCATPGAAGRPDGRLARLLVPLDPWRYYELGRAADQEFHGRLPRRLEPQAAHRRCCRPRATATGSAPTCSPRDRRAGGGSIPSSTTTSQDATALTVRGRRRSTTCVCISVLEHIGPARDADGPGRAVAGAQAGRHPAPDDRRRGRAEERLRRRQDLRRGQRELRASRGLLQARLRRRGASTRSRRAALAGRAAGVRRQQTNPASSAGSTHACRGRTSYGPLLRCVVREQLRRLEHAGRDLRGRTSGVVYLRLVKQPAVSGMTRRGVRSSSARRGRTARI